MATVLIPIPDTDFDPTEVAVSWQVLTGRGHGVVFSTESGRQAVADDIMVSGRGLDVWSRVPGLGRVAVVGRFLRANRDARAAYADMRNSAEYQHPIAWTHVRLDDVDALLLPGGHRARGMRSYIDSEVLQALVVEAFRRGMLVAAICHGVLLAAVDRPFGALRPQDHRAHMGFRTSRVAADPLHQVLGPRLLPNLFRTAWRSRRLHVGGGGSHSRA
jgi:putative intracellular protease/amidase